ncbi:unnamed protein product [Symbiodinium sp. CCMP2456]|nr:unnamed protein product [Symbiodinium sp. CCMP2456]
MGNNGEAMEAASIDPENDLVLEFDFNGTRKIVCSALLCLASPVFRGMLRAGMKEAQQKSVRVEVAMPEDFELFYGLLLPGEWNLDAVTESNVDALLAISDYYQVGFIKKGCEKRLLDLPVSMDRLLQAHRHGLTQQCGRCINSLAAQFTEKDLVKIGEAAPDLLLLAAQAVRKEALSKQNRIDQLEPALKRARNAYEGIRAAAANFSEITKQALEPQGRPPGLPRPPPSSLHIPQEQVNQLKAAGTKLDADLRKWGHILG